MKRDTVLPPIRISAEEKALLERAAAVCQLSLSEYLRRYGLEHARRTLTVRGVLDATGA